MSSATPPPPYQQGPPPYQPGPPQPGRRTTHTPASSPNPRLGLWISLGAGAFVLAVIAVVITLQVAASSAYDSALDAWREATTETAAAQTALSAAASEGTDAAANAVAIVATAPDGLVDTAARDAFATAAATLDESALAAADAASVTVPDSTGDRPTVFWDLFGAANELRGEVGDLDRERRDLAAAADSVADDTGALDETADVLYLSTDTAGPAFEAAHIDARNAEVIVFRDAQDTVSGTVGVGIDAVDAMAAYAAAADGVIVSEQEELASIAGPLYDARLAAQAFARSIDGGVLVEFDWAPIVYGAGEGGSVGGYTTWNYDHGGHAIIQLSNSVAELWPQPVTLNLVAHEVGHAISAKCYDLYDDRDQASIEAFATAWAISMGYTGDGNGVSLYGYPAQSVIDAAATCR